MTEFTERNLLNRIFLRENGFLAFGITSETENKILVMGKGTYHDGTWHLASAVSVSNTMALYVDGELEASTNAGPALDYEGFWRIGYDQLSDWPYAPIRFTLFGLMDDVRIYKRPLSQSEIQELYHEGNWEGE